MSVALPTVPFLEQCRCTECSLYPTRIKLFCPVGGEGSYNARILLIGEGPGTTEAAVGRPFIGESGKFLNAALAEVGLKRTDCFVTNAVMCRHQDGHTPVASEMMACSGRLHAEITACTNRHVIVVMGSSAIKAVTGNQGSVSNLQGRIEWHPELGAFVTYTWHPAAILRNPDHCPDFLYALGKAKELLTTKKGAIAPPVQVRWHIYDTAEEAVAQLNWMRLHLAGRVACDIETTGLDWQTDNITQIGFSWNGRTSYLFTKHVFHEPYVLAALRLLFQTPAIKWVWHNGKFDVQFLKMLLNYMPRVDEDTMLKHYLLDERGGGQGENGGTTHSLKPLAYKYCSAPIWDEGIKASKDFTNPSYHAHDLVYTHRLDAVLDAEHEHEKPSQQGYPLPINAYRKVAIPAINVIADIEMIGFRIDEEEMTRLEERFAGSDFLCEDGTTQHRDGELDVLEKTCQSLAGVTFPRAVSVKTPYIVDKTKGRGKNKIVVQETKYRREKVTVQDPINIRSTPQVGYFLYDHLGLPKMYAKGSKSGEPTTNEEVLTLYADQHPFILKLLNYREQHKLYSTYVKGIVKKIGTDGATHSHFSLHRTVTGRPSSIGPNLQNIPKNVKSPFIARPGMVLIQADYSNQEVRAGAWLSGDVQLQADITVQDFHWEVTRAVFTAIVNDLLSCEGSLEKLEDLMARRPVFRQVQLKHELRAMDAEKLFDELREHIRKASKAVTFGVMYREGGMGLAHNLYVKSGIEITDREGDQYITNWLAKYHGFAEWAEEREYDVEHAGFVDTPTGRRRRFHYLSDENINASKRQAVNMPIQSVSSDMTVMSVVKVHTLFKQLGIGHVLLFVHDSIIAEVYAGREKEAAQIMRDVMENIVYDIDPNCCVAFPVAIEVGSRWSSLKKMA